MFTRIHTEYKRCQNWIERYRNHRPGFVNVLGFTATALLEGISSAGITPSDRKITAVADAEFLFLGRNDDFKLPTLTSGASPVLISRAVVDELQLPLFIFNSGLPYLPSVPFFDLQGVSARCLGSGFALDKDVVESLWVQGLKWGAYLSHHHPYLLLSECVVGGTSTALAVLTALGIDARSKVSSSHRLCNHDQKWQLVQAGLSRARFTDDPLSIPAGVGDPMQVVVAGMAIAASLHCGVLLAGGSQMLAVYALAERLAKYHRLTWCPESIVVGTTRWVMEDVSSDVEGLAVSVGAPLISSSLSFLTSRWEALRAYELGFVKEGMGAGGAAIVAHLYGNWDQQKLLLAIEKIWSQTNPA